jgi:hypothetical protein
MYYIRVMRALYNRFRPGPERYKHYAALQEDFYANLRRHKIISANNFAVDIGRIEGNFRIVRFVRDPRDLVVSGYFYHKRGAEPWFRRVSPTPTYWKAINGNVPRQMPCGLSFADYLGGLSEEDGLIAEIEFRKCHFESLRQWPDSDQILLFKYEDIVGNEAEVFGVIFDFYELPRHERLVGTWLANHYSAARRAGDSHVRNAAAGQWRKHFTPKVDAYFKERYADLLEILAY